MRKIFLELLTLCCVFISTPSFSAESVSVSVTGRVESSTCVISADSRDMTITFPDITYERAATAGTLATQNYKISLSDCPLSQSVVSLKFSGNPDTINPGKAYANSGTAKNVAVEIVTSNNSEMGNQKSSALVISNQKTTLNLIASLVSRGNATAGTILTNVTGEVVYN
ncbi:type 1 fimbrial protein [Enterobacter cloacae]|nr:type 1 fimbrial protein [Enterobacter cloacae]